ncbi:MAG TPA: lipopolysaccharide biosynthesis protein [Candidatus Angelobacter sp.]|nr:lipopolysaccharide biosynthesis protein [Candidatus Angelobacter sp.]
MSSAVTDPAQPQQAKTGLAGDPMREAAALQPEQANSGLAASLQAIPSLRTNFKWTFAGSMIYAGCQWGMLSILAKAGSATIVGQFALGLAIAAPVFMFTNLQLRGVQATDARSEFEFCDYFTLRLLASTLGLITVAAIAFTLRYDLTTRLVVILVAAAKTVESLSDVVAGLLQKFERLDQVAVSLMIRGALSVAAFGGTFLATHRLTLAVAAMVLTWIAVFAVYDLWRARGVLGSRAIFFRLRGAVVRKLLVLSAPLGVVMALVSLNINLPRYLLVKYMGQAELGIFASMAYLVVAAILIINALGQSASARLARMFAEGDRAGFWRVIKKLLFTALLVPAAGVPIALLFGRRLLTLLYRPEYGEHVSVLVILLAVTGLTAIASFMGYGLTAARAFRIQPVIIGATALTTLVMCVILIPRFGLNGAALALLSSEIVYAGSATLALLYAVRTTKRA